jgi:predicted MFS family arabinose efflux permease
MPPVNQSNQVGWKAFFALLGVCQMVLLGVMWRTYDAVSESAKLTTIHEYQIREEIRPAIKSISQALMISESGSSQKDKPPKS